MVLEDKAKHVYTVSEITKELKLLLENTFGAMWVEGEVSNFRPHSSGHFYFTLKDERAVLAAVMFKRANQDLKFKIENGLKIICFGNINVYEARGQHQLIVEKIEPKGIGAQQLAFEQLKKKLFKEGLFDPAHKKPLPLMPFRVGIITSRSGAALQDILQILKKGAGFVNIIVRSVRVQGVGAASEIASAVNEFDQLKQVDTIIICRGGGSEEDLWPFNEEAVARAIYRVSLPTISAVGHQINVTLADMVADAYVETPSAAAKIIVDKKNSLLADLDGYRHNLNASFLETLYNLNNRFSALKHMLKSPLDRLLEKQQLLDEFFSSLVSHFRNYLSITQGKTKTLIGRLEALSPLAILSRGYSLSMLMPQEAILQDVEEIKKGNRIKTILARGAFLSTVEEVNRDEGEET